VGSCPDRAYGRLDELHSFLLFFTFYVHGHLNSHMSRPDGHRRFLVIDFNSCFIRFKILGVFIQYFIRFKVLGVDKYILIAYKKVVVVYELIFINENTQS
jgi:hypothetical protein